MSPIKKLFRKLRKKKPSSKHGGDDCRESDDTSRSTEVASDDVAAISTPPRLKLNAEGGAAKDDSSEIIVTTPTKEDDSLKSIIRATSSNGGDESVASSKKRCSVTFSPKLIETEEEEKIEDPFPNHHTKRELKRLSSCSSKYNISGTGKLDKFEQLARTLDSHGRGSVDPSTVIQLLKEQDALRKRQWLLLLGNIIQWLPIIVGAVYTFFKFTERQYQQNVGGKILTSMDYIKKGIVTSDEIDSLWELSRGKAYPLTNEHKRNYLRDGFVVLPNFLTEDESQALDKVVTHNLNEMAFPDLLTKCSRKFHGEHYHSTVTHRFWQQPRIADMLSSMALDGDTGYMVTSEILEMPSGVA